MATAAWLTVLTTTDAADKAEAASADAGLIVLPANRLAPEFFQLSTGVAGEMLQKFVLYRKRLAIIGDLSMYTQESKALRDFVYESNRGPAIWFLVDRSQLEDRLSATAQA